MTIRKLLWLVMSTIIVLLALALLIQEGWSTWQDLPQTAELSLGPVQSQLASDVERWFAPLAEQLQVARHLYQSAQIQLADRAAFDRSLLALMGRSEHVERAALVTPRGTQWLLERGADAYRATVWGETRDVSVYLYERGGRFLGEEHTLQAKPEFSGAAEALSSIAVVTEAGARERVRVAPAGANMAGAAEMNLLLPFRDPRRENLCLVLHARSQALSALTARLLPGHQYSMITWRRGDILAPPAIASAPAKELSTSMQHPLADGLAFWRTLAEPAPTAFSAEAGGRRWWFRVRELDLGAAMPLILITGVEEQMLLRPFYRHATIILATAGAGLVLASILALMVARALRRPLMAVVQEAKQLNVLDQPGFWPRTRIRELRDVIRAFEEIREIQPVAEVTAESAARPPDAFMQALSSARQQLKSAEAEVGTLQHEAAHWHLACVEIESRLTEFSTCLRELHQMRRQSGAAIAAMGCWHIQQHGIAAGASVWRREMPAAQWRCVAAAGAVSASVGKEIDGLPDAFLERIDLERVLIADDARADVRTVEAARSFVPESHAGLAIAVVPGPGDGVRELLCLHGAGAWPPEMPLVVAALAASLSGMPVAALAGATTVTSADGLFQAAFDSLPVLAWILDEQGRIRYCNAGVERFFGASVEEMLGEQIGARVEEPENVEEALWGVWSHGLTQTVEAEVESRNGQRALLRITMSLLENDNAEPEGIVAVGIVDTAHEET